MQTTDVRVYFLVFETISLVLVRESLLKQPVAPQTSSVFVQQRTKPLLVARNPNITHQPQELLSELADLNLSAPSFL